MSASRESSTAFYVSHVEGRHGHRQQLESCWRSCREANSSEQLTGQFKRTGSWGIFGSRGSTSACTKTPSVKLFPVEQDNARACRTVFPPAPGEARFLSIVTPLRGKARAQSQPREQSFRLGPIPVRRCATILLRSLSAARVSMNLDHSTTATKDAVRATLTPKRAAYRFSRFC